MNKLGTSYLYFINSTDFFTTFQYRNKVQFSIIELLIENVRKQLVRWIASLENHLNHYYVDHDEIFLIKKYLIKNFIKKIEEAAMYSTGSLKTWELMLSVSIASLFW